MNPVFNITTLSDERLKDFSHRTDVALKNDQKHATGIYIAESALVLERSLRVGHEPRAVLSLGNTLEQAQKLLLAHPSTPIFTGPGELLAELTGYELHRGLIASLNRPKLATVSATIKNANNIVILEDVADPTNVGAIFRSVAAIGADAVLVTPRCSDPFYRRAIRVSMGSVMQVPWTRTSDDWGKIKQELNQHGFIMAALALDENAYALNNLPKHIKNASKVALVLGSEGHGLSSAAIAACDCNVIIPMKHNIDSLNVAAASAVAVWEIMNRK